MRATITKLLLLPCFAHVDRTCLAIFVFIISLALAVLLGDFALLSADSPPARSALAAPVGGS